jgi:hypothetical protein
LFDEPMIPTRYPETVAKKNPTRSMTMAATTPSMTLPERYSLQQKIGMISPILDPSSEPRSGKSWGQLGFGAAPGEPMVSVNQIGEQADRRHEGISGNDPPIGQIVPARVVMNEESHDK